MAAVRWGRSKRSRTLTAGHRRDIGLYDVLMCMGLPGLGRVMMVAVFQIEGMSDFARERLKSWVRKEMPEGPRCLRWRMVRLSGPVALEVPDFFMADKVSAVVKKGKEWSRG